MRLGATVERTSANRMLDLASMLDVISKSEVVL